MTKTDDPGVAFVDDAHAPDVFADGTAGLFVHNGNLRITLECLRASHVSPPIPISRVVVGRLVMPLAAAEAMARSILTFVERQKAQAVKRPSRKRTVQ